MYSQEDISKSFSLFSAHSHDTKYREKRLRFGEQLLLTSSKLLVIIKLTPPYLFIHQTFILHLPFIKHSAWPCGDQRDNDLVPELWKFTV